MPVFDFICTNSACATVVKDRLIPYAQITQQTCPTCGAPLERQHTVGKLTYHFDYFADED